jgi:hypothetical protein
MGLRSALDWTWTTMLRRSGSPMALRVKTSTTGSCQKMKTLYPSHRTTTPWIQSHQMMIQCQFDQMQAPRMRMGLLPVMTLLLHRHHLCLSNTILLATPHVLADLASVALARVTTTTNKGTGTHTPDVTFLLDVCPTWTRGVALWIYYDEVRYVVINRGIPDNKRV